MKTIDKIVRTLLCLIGMIFQVIATSIGYITGIIWTGYMAIRGRNYKKVFTTLNDHVARDFIWILDEIKFCAR